MGRNETFNHSHNNLHFKSNYVSFLEIYASCLFYEELHYILVLYLSLQSRQIHIKVYFILLGFSTVFIVQQLLLILIQLFNLAFNTEKCATVGLVQIL